MGGMQLLSRVLTRHSAHHRKPYRSAAFSITRGIRTSSALFQSTQPGHVYVWGGNREAFGSIEGVDDTREPVHLNTFQQPASKVSALYINAIVHVCTTSFPISCVAVDGWTD